MYKDKGVCFRCPGTEVAMHALTGRKVDMAFRIYQALLGAAAGGHEAQPMDQDLQVTMHMVMHRHAAGTDLSFAPPLLHMHTLSPAPPLLHRQTCFVPIPAAQTDLSSLLRLAVTQADH